MEKKWKKAIWWLLGIALIVFFRGTLWRIALLLLVSATLAYLLDPLMRLYRQKAHFGENLSAVMAFATVVLAMLAFALFGVPALVRQITALGQSTPQLVESFSNFVVRITNKLSSIGLPPEAVSVIKAEAGGLLALGAQFLAGRLMMVVNGVRNLGYLIFSPLLAFYMLKDKQRLFAYMTRLIPSRYRKSTLRMGLAVRDAIAAYVHGQLTVSMITGALTSLGLLIIGLPSWLAMGVVMMLCNLIPYFGPWLGTIPIVIFSITEGLPMVLGGVLVVLIAQQIEGLVITPRVIGNVASLHPAMVVLSLIAGGWIAGLPGMFYSIPVVVTVRAVLRTVRDARLHP